MYTTTSNNYLGTDKYGNDWYAQVLNNGNQVWVESKNGIVWDGGVNMVPRPWNSVTGLKKP